MFTTMGSINKVFLIGRLTGLPDLRYTPKGTAVTEISIAVNRVWTDSEGTKREEATFVDVTLWGRQAEIAQQYLRKGSPVLIEGRLQLDTWEDKQSGQKRSRLRVVAENLQLIGDRSTTSSAQPAPSQGAPRTGLPEPDLDV
jgi:single-strand DNA-binding protein